MCLYVKVLFNIIEMYFSVFVEEDIILLIQSSSICNVYDLMEISFFFIVTLSFIHDNYVYNYYFIALHLNPCLNRYQAILRDFKIFPFFFFGKVPHIVRNVRSVKSN